MVAAPSAAERADPIVGMWSYARGAVAIRPAGTIFEGVVVRDLRFLQCTHRAGERMWTIVRTRSGYAGRQLSFGAGIGCRNRIWISANWQISGDSLRVWAARRSSQWPRRCGAQTDCFTLARVGPVPRPPEPAPERWSLSLDLTGPPEWGEWGLAASYQASTATAAGSFTLNQGRVAGLAGTLTVTHDNSGESDTSMKLRIKGARGFEREGNSRLLRALVSVVSSNGTCGEGETGKVWLKDAPGGDVFAIRVCDERLQFRNGANGAKVEIALAKSG